MEPELPDRWDDASGASGDTARPHRYIGWLSNPKADSESNINVEIHLDTPALIDGIAMFPARRPTLGAFPGLGLPKKFRLESVDAEGYAHTLLDQTETVLHNPGENPFKFRFPAAEVSRVRLVCPEIWTGYPNYYAFLGFSEIQLNQGSENRALGAKVSVSDKPGRQRAHEQLFWDEQSLTDGYGPEGKLLSRRQWLEKLDRRLALELREIQLRNEMDAIISQWRNRLFTGISGLSLVALTGLIILPVRHRIHERRQLRRLRQRIADDLHDELGANLTSIAGSAELLTEIVENPSPKQNELLKDIGRTAKKSAEETRLLIHFLESKGIEGGLIPQFEIAVSKMLGGMVYEEDYSEKEVFNALPPVLKWDLLLFLKESLNNIVKHAEASKVRVQASADPKRLQLSIYDDGNGLPDGRHPSHLTSRANRIGGELKIISQTGIGTEILLTIPRNRLIRWTKRSR